MFDRQVERDKIKQELCDKQCVKLIIIPYNIKMNDIQAFIIEECEKQNIVVPNITKITDILSKIN